MEAKAQQVNAEQLPDHHAQQFQLKGLEFVCETEGYRYYKDAQSGRQCCLDSAGFWYVFNEEKGVFETADIGLAQQQDKKANETRKRDERLRNVSRFGIKFDHNGKPIYPKNEKGLFILPKDERGLPFFPVDEIGHPIFPWDYVKNHSTFPVDGTEEPIFPRNERNKPIVPMDGNGQPIFPKDDSGSFIFPLDESHCPIPALTTDGISVVPKDEFGNLVIPQDRDGKPLIHIASDGVTPISAAEWKQWKKYYREHMRNFYQQQQQSQVQGPGTFQNSMFHPLNLEQQSVFFAADMEMLQLIRRVRPEDVDLPGHPTDAYPGPHSEFVGAPSQENGTTTADDEKQRKRKKFLEAQLKSVKKVIPIQKKNESRKTEKAIATKREQQKDRNKKRREKEMVEKKRVWRTEKKSDRKRPKQQSSRSYSSSGSYSTSSSSSHRKQSKSKRRRSSSERSYNSSGSASSRTSSVDTKDDEKRIRNRIISRSKNSIVDSTNNTNSQKYYTAEEYGPQPPKKVEKIADGSDMEMSDEEQENNNNTSAIRQQQQQEFIGRQNERGKMPNEKGTIVLNALPGNEKHIHLKEIIKSDNLELIRFCMENERIRYEQLKLKIAEMEVEKSVIRRNWAQLKEAERRAEGEHKSEPSSSGSES